MKTLLPLLILGLLALSARGTEPDDQLPPAPHGKSLKLVYQDGTLAEASVEQLHRLNRALRS